MLELVGLVTKVNEVFHQPTYGLSPINLIDLNNKPNASKKLTLLAYSVFNITLNKVIWLEGLSISVTTKIRKYPVYPVNPVIIFPAEPANYWCKHSSACPEQSRST